MGFLILANCFFGVAKPTYRLGLNPEASLYLGCHADLVPDPGNSFGGFCQ